jgi:hypothetical protein
VVSPLVLAEIDYMVLDKVGVDQELAVIDDLTSGAYEIADVDVDDVRAARGLAARHRDLVLLAAVAAPVVFPGHARKLFGAAPGDPEFETRYASGLRRLIAHLTPEGRQ